MKTITRFILIGAVIVLALCFGVTIGHASGSLLSPVLIPEDGRLDTSIPTLRAECKGNYGGFTWFIYDRPALPPNSMSRAEVISNLELALVFHAQILQENPERPQAWDAHWVEVYRQALYLLR